MKGKIIKIYNSIGVIEFDLDKRISYSTLDYNFRIGDHVEFDIITREVLNTSTQIEVASNIQLINERPRTTQRFSRLGKLAGEYNVPIKYIVEILSSYGFELEKQPHVKVGEEQVLILENHLNNEKTKKLQEKENVKIERGTIIHSRIVQIVHPSLVVLEFFDGKEALLPLNNLSWNKSRSERIVYSLNRGDCLEVVILENEENQIPIVSRKHLIPRPSETSEWQELKIGEHVKGKIIDVLINEVIIELENGYFGRTKITSDLDITVDGLVDFNVVSKDQLTYYIGLSVQVPNITEIEDLSILEEIGARNLINSVEQDTSIVSSSYQIRETDLQNFENFQSSIYYSFCKDDEALFIEKAFESNPYLFASSIEFRVPLYVQFAFNLPAWESDFQNKLIPYLGSESKTYTTKSALDYLGRQKYWIRINRYFKDTIEQVDWMLFNEEFMFNGKIEDEASIFKISGITIKRTSNFKSFLKSLSQSNGTFIYDSEIVFLGPSSALPFDANQIELFTFLDEKSKALELIKKLKKETGALLLEAGHSIHIFDRFLEYQEELLKKGNVSNQVIFSGEFKRVATDKGELSIHLNENLEELCEKNELEVFVVVRTLEGSTREGISEEMRFFADANLEIRPNGSQLHFSNGDLLLTRLETGFSIEPKVSTRQFSVQRDVIQDFFAKKIKLQHIEALLLKPEKIVPPDKPQLSFYNNMLSLTEQSNPENNQVNSVKKSVGNKNIFLIQGPPGTGKTTVIAEIVKQLTDKGEKILVASQTHIAVDNVLEKIAENENLTLLRIGKLERIHPDLVKFQKDKLIERFQNHFEEIISLNIELAEKFQASIGSLSERDLIKFIEDNARYPEELVIDLIKYNNNFIKVLLSLSFEDLPQLVELLTGWKNSVASEQSTLITPLMYSSVDVVFATCIGVRTDKDLTDYNVSFDTVIIDEAGKANLSESIAASAMAKKVILVGDQMQLPPFIDGSLLDPDDEKSFTNSKFGKSFDIKDVQHALKTSFFEFLVSLMDNGRFPKSNIEMLNYQHRMHPHIGQFISDAFYEGQVKMGESTTKNVLPMSVPFDKQIVFLDTSTAENPYEQKQGLSVKNDAEAQCIVQFVVPKLIEQGLSISNFAIIAPYKSQVSNIQEHLKSSNAGLYQQIDVSTLDSFQGMEFDVIIFSFTRSAIASKVGFLDDARRLNVAFSRAKKKLILIGNSETLTDAQSHYDQLFNYTGLFKSIIKICKNEAVGNFVNVTDYTSLESKFSKNKHLVRENCTVQCKLKLTFETPNYLGHIFYIGDKGLEGMFRDDEKNFEYDSDVSYEFYISRVDKSGEKIYLSNITPPSIAFFKNREVGDKIDGQLKLEIPVGYIFEIEPGLDCLLYDPKHQQTFEQNKSYSLFIEKLDEPNRKIGVSLTLRRQIVKTSVPKKTPISKRNFIKSLRKGETVKAKYKHSIEIGHFFEIERGIDGFVFDPGSKIRYLKKGEVYELIISKIDLKMERIGLIIKSK